MPQTTLGSILVVEDEERIQKLVVLALQRAGYDVTAARDGVEALALLEQATPDLVVSDVQMPGLDGFELLKRLRSDPLKRAIPVILLTARSSTKDVVAGLGLGADDYLAKPFNTGELLARVRAKIERPPVPQDLLPHDRQTALLSEARLLDEVGRELARAERGGAAGYVAVVRLDELPRVLERLPARAGSEVARQAAALIGAGAQRLDLAGRDRHGRFLLLLPETGEERVRERLDALSRALAGHVFEASGERLRFTPTIGYAPFADGLDAPALLARAELALQQAALHLDLRPVGYTASMSATAVRRPWVWWALLRSTAQVLLTLLAGIGLPFLAYVLLGAAGFDVSGPMYLAVVASLLLTAALIWWEALLAVRRVDPPEQPAGSCPLASAVIAAYLPNEAAAIVETVECFLRLDYPGPLQVILAYNTPQHLPVEAVLEEIARRDPRFILLHVETSTSKAQNVNAAMAHVTGEFVGIFDADHHPDPDSFRRAWRWLASGYDLVQGHCVVRNGHASWVARLTAVEFETIYALCHPGRARLHHFGVFGGSNGYWRTSLLQQTRMHGSMLTEDIDSSIRVVTGGRRIASDPWLISRELGPATLKALWHQRMRWAQGWFQVALKHTWSGMRSRRLSLRQKLGLVQLLAWREIFPWLSIQVIPILAYWIWWQHRHLNWFIPLFVFTTAFTLSTGPVQALLTYRVAEPQIRKRKAWFVFYFVMSFLFYSEFKNMIARVAQMKECMRERQWKVTPRAAHAKVQ